MKVTFVCHGCGKKLKARPDSVGRTRKCPVCATRVTCPEPVVAAKAIDGQVLDAEVLMAEVVPSAPAAAAAARWDAARQGPAHGLDPYADIDDEPYRLVDAAPATSTPMEPKRPCPMCGEIILASAVKCRFCGEVFDEAIIKGNSKKRRKSYGTGVTSTTRAREIAAGLLCIALGIGLTIASLASASEDDPNGRRFILFYGLIIGGFIQVCRGTYGLITSS
jgi:hypothetical protein